MSYLLASTTIRRPVNIQETNSSLFAEQKTLNGTLTRDYFGSKKRIWNLKYEKTTVDDFNTIKTIYDSYLSTSTAQAWQVTDSNYVVSSTTVHLDLIERDFNYRGYTMLCDFDLILTEA